MHLRVSKLAVYTSTLALLFAVAAPVSAQTVSTIRVRLHSYMADAGTLPPSALAKLEALAGTGLTLIGTTRTGALDLALAQPQDSTAIAATLRALRNDRGVLWAETPRVASASAKSAQVLPPGATATGQRVMVRLKDGAEVVVQPGERTAAGVEILSGLHDGDGAIHLALPGKPVCPRHDDRDDETDEQSD